MTKIYYKLINEIKLIDIDDFSDSIKNHLRLKKNKEKFKESLAGWTLLNQVLPNVNFKTLDVRFNESGKPFCNQLFFNISHSKDLVCVAVSDNEVGIDIEYVDLTKDISKLSLKLFGTILDIYEFYDKFTKLEAYAKYNGKSLMMYKNIIQNILNKSITTKIEINNQIYSMSYICCDKIAEIKKL